LFLLVIHFCCIYPDCVNQKLTINMQRTSKRSYFYEQWQYIRKEHNKILYDDVVIGDDDDSQAVISCSTNFERLRNRLSGVGHKSYSLARRLEVSHKYLFQRSVNFLARSEMEREETLQFAARRRFYQSPSNVFFSWIIALQMVGVGSH
jgi:hypothetical protein